jgi:hypothetical protein
MKRPLHKMLLPSVVLLAMVACQQSNDRNDYDTTGAGSGPASAQESPPVNDAEDKLTLTTSFALEGQELVLRYEVHNGDDRDVYLLNRIPGMPPERNLSTNNIYIGVDRASRTVKLYKRIPGYRGKGTGPTSLVSPYVTPVRAGTTFREEVRLPLPLLPWEEYGQGVYGPNGTIRGKQKAYHQITFELGFFWRAPDTTETPKEAYGEQVILPYSPSHYPQFGELRSQAVSLELPVMEPTDKD